MQQKKHKRTINDLQNTTYKTKDPASGTTLKTGGQLRCSGSSCCSTLGTRRITLVTNPVISHEWGKDLEVLNHPIIHTFIQINEI
jgi:hypothetical protein